MDASKERIANGPACKCKNCTNTSNQDCNDGESRLSSNEDKVSNEKEEVMEEDSSEEEEEDSNEEAEEDSNEEEGEDSNEELEIEVLHLLSRTTINFAHQ